MSIRHPVFRRPVILLYAGCLFSQPLRAWNQEGHMLVAQIAYNHLDPTVKAKCDALIAVPLAYGGSSTSSFVTASCWADDYRNDLGTSTWHYIDLPISLDGTSYANFVPPPCDVVQAINLSISTLQSPAATEVEQAASLRYLLHFLGDIQQPLHCTAAFFASQPNGDAGGNGFRITGTWTNLHALWDSGGGYLNDPLSRPLTAANQTTLNSRVAAIEAAHPYTPDAGTIPNPMIWAIEGKGLALSACYSGITLNTAPSSTYLQIARATTEARMASGGHRLADLLNTVFSLKPSPFRLDNGDFGFSWNAVPGMVYHIEWTEDLVNPSWTPLPDVTASGSTAYFQEAPVNGRRFYRLQK